MVSAQDHAAGFTSNGVVIAVAQQAHLALSARSEFLVTRLVTRGVKTCPKPSFRVTSWHG